MRELNEFELATLSRLHANVVSYQNRNRLRSAYAEGEHRIERLGFSIPPQMAHFGVVIGWPQKSCEVLSSRLVPEGFSMATRSGLLDQLEDVFASNYMMFLERQAIDASIRHGVSFLFTTRGDTSVGEPEVLVTASTALSASCEIDPRSRIVTSALEVLGGSRINLYLPGVVLLCVRRPGGWVVEDEYLTGHNRVTCTPYVHGATIEKPLGRSRITKPLMNYTDAAVRTFLRQEVSAEFYSAPRIMALGGGREMFEDGEGNVRTGWEAIIGAAWAIPDEEDEMTGERHRVSVEQLPQMSMQPHSDQLRLIAQMASGETGIPVSYLGVVQDGNPTSAEAIYANEVDLVRIAMGQQPSLGMGRLSLAKDVLTVLNGDLGDAGEEDLRGLTARWADPRTRSITEQSQFVAQQVGSGNFQPGTEATLSQLPISPETVKQIASENRRGSVSQLVSGIGERLAAAEGDPLVAAAAAARDGSGLVPVVPVIDPDELSKKFEALGTAIRAGVVPASAAAYLGLDGLEFTGAVPVSLRQPESEAKKLEEA